MKNVVIVGRGKVGRTLARALRDVRLVSGRSRQFDGEVFVLAVPDAAITQVASRLAASLASHSLASRRRTVVVHCAGRLDATPLAACAAMGAHVGVLHPLASFADAKRPPSLVGATLVVAGDVHVVRAARRIARALASHVLVAPIHGAAYHAAAAMVAAGGASVVSAAAGVLAAHGVSRAEAERALAGLLATVAQNVASLGASRALTGPVARGDEATIEAHRRALHADRAALALYDSVTAAARNLNTK